MSAPNQKHQKKGWETIDKLFADAENVWVIHYSCESFYDRTDGRSPRITSLAVRKFDNAQTFSFSIHQVAERTAVPFADIDQHFDALEKQMLEEFFAHVRSHQNVKYLHWNMRDSNYGFAAIEHRYRVLGGDPFRIPDDRKYDLARILIDIYGTGYIGHPRLEKIIEKNSITERDFLNGAEEAQAFESRNLIALHLSTLRKVDILANIAGRVYDRNLKTNTSWWEMHGGKLRTFINWLADMKALQLIATIGGICGLAYSIYQWIWPWLHNIIVTNF
jgi:hypothetical protein